MVLVHVSQLKAFHGILPTVVQIQEWIQGSDSSVVLTPSNILDRKIKKVQEKAKAFYLIQLTGFLELDAT